jgi:flagellar protein FliS
MPGVNPYKSYLSVQYETADQGTLILMSYDAAIRFCKAASQSIADNDKVAKGDWLQKAFDLVGELRRSLRPDGGAGIAQKLDLGYAYIGRQITLANVTSRPEHIDNALEILEQLRDAWRQIVRQTRHEQAVVA